MYQFSQYLVLECCDDKAAYRDFAINDSIRCLHCNRILFEIPFWDEFTQAREEIIDDGVDDSGIPF